MPAELYLQLLQANKDKQSSFRKVFCPIFQDYRFETRHKLYHWNKTNECLVAKPPLMKKVNEQQQQTLSFFYVYFLTTYYKKFYEY